MKKLFDAFHLPYWLVGIMALSLILRIPSFFEPYHYGDEMIYLALGQGIREGLTLYRDIHDNKPPLIYILAAIAGSLFWFKIILAFWNMISIVIFAKLADILFPEKLKLQKIATLIFGILTTIPLLEGNIVNAEILMIAPTLLGIIYILKRNQKPTDLFVAGLAFSFASLFKIPAAFEMAGMAVFMVISSDLKELKSTITKLIYLALGFIIPIGITFVWYSFKGAFSEYLIAAYLQNVGYLSAFRPGDVREPFLVKNLPLLVRAGIVFMGVILLWFKRRQLSKPFIFLTVWLLFALFAVTLSERPYPHYLIQTVPVVAFFAAMLFSEKTKEQVLVLVPLLIFSLVPFYYRFWYYPTGSYYARFIKFAQGNITKDQYLNSFSSQVRRNYEVASFLTNSTPPGERVFIYSEDAPVIYALSRKLPPIRYVVNYHINDYTEKSVVATEFTANPPKFIILATNEAQDADISAVVREKYMLIHEIETAEIWSRYEKR